MNKINSKLDSVTHSLLHAVSLRYNSIHAAINPNRKFLKNNYSYKRLKYFTQHSQHKSQSTLYEQCNGSNQQTFPKHLAKYHTTAREHENFLDANLFAGLSDTSRKAYARRSAAPIAPLAVTYRRCKKVFGKHIECRTRVCAYYTARPENGLDSDPAGRGCVIRDLPFDDDVESAERFAGLCPYVCTGFLHCYADWW